MKNKTLSLILLFALPLTACKKDEVSTEGAPTAADLATYTSDLTGAGALTAQIETDFGTFSCVLFAEQTPITVANFVGLARGLHPFKDTSGNWVERPFFDGTRCHRVIPGFMMQCGDPTATGTGGPGYRFGDEFVSSLRHDKAGVLSMANAGPNTNGSQFFITEGPTAGLNDKHTVFGQCEPAALVKTITNVPRGANDTPKTPVVLKKVTIIKK